MSTYSFNVSNDPRERAASIAQTLNAGGSVTNVIYTLPNGFTVEDVYAYGTQSTTEPVLIVRGTLRDPEAGTLLLSDVAIGNRGTTITYTPNFAVASLVGTLFIGATGYNITHVSSGLANINTEVVKGTTGANISIINTATNPRLVSSLAYSPISNGSKLQLLAVSGPGASVSGKRVSLAAANNTAVSVQTFPANQPLEVYTMLPAEATAGVYPAVSIDTDSSLYAGWSLPGGDHVMGAAVAYTGIYVTDGYLAPGTVGVASAGSGPCYCRMITTGNGTFTLETSLDQSTWALRKTVTGVSTSATLWVKVLSTNGACGADVVVYA